MAFSMVFIARLPHCRGRIAARIAIHIYVGAAARAAEVDARRGGFGGGGGAARPKRRFVNSSRWLSSETARNRLRSFPRKRESRGWVPAFAGTSGTECL